MSRRSKTLRALCAEVGPDDGLDPRDIQKEKQRNSRASASPREGRKARQLGQQVAETLDAVLAGESRDDVLSELRVVSVSPAIGGAHLVVTVAPRLASDGLDPVDVLARLAKASPRLRYEVASAITRRRTPILTYQFAVNVDKA